MERNGRIATAYFKVFKGGSINPNIKILKCNIGVFFRVFRLMTVVFVSLFLSSPKAPRAPLAPCPCFFLGGRTRQKRHGHTEGDRREEPRRCQPSGKPKGWKNLKNRCPLQKGGNYRHLQGGPPKTPL